MFSKRQCSNVFLNAVDDGLINFDILDRSKFYRQEFSYSERKESVVIQFRKLQSGPDEIKNKKDQMILAINGLGIKINYRGLWIGLEYSSESIA